MAEKIELNSVDKFDPHSDPTHLAQSWERWLRSFELFAAGKGVTDFDQKRALLLHCAGMAVQDIYFTLTEEDGDNVYQKVTKTLEKHFEQKINVPYERYAFRTMKQEDSETIEEFITRLRRKAVLCKFANVDQQIRDQVIEKCRSHKLRVKLLEKGHDLTLENLRLIASTVERVQDQAKQMEGQSPMVESVHRVTNKGARPKSQPRQNAKPKGCFRCGKVGHFAKDPSCPAKDKICHKCGFKGHFQKFCNTKQKGKGKEKGASKFNNSNIRLVKEDSSSDEYAFSVGSGTEKMSIYLDGHCVDVIIDSGATVNIIDKSMWESLKAKHIKCKSERSNKKLYTYSSDKPLDLIGKFSTVVSLKGPHREIEADFYVINGEGPALLGKQTAMDLGVLKIEINAVQDDKLKRHAECFNGIGKLSDYELKLHIDDSVEPVAQRMYRIPFSLQERVTKKLDELESLDIIEKVNTPMSWVSPVLVVPKPNGDIRLCVDMRQANKAIVREQHPIPTVDEILYKMNGSEVFSKLDLRLGYHQIVLEEKSRDITTFVTNNGLYRYKRLMFGINMAPQKYQQVISQVFNDCEGVLNISDDIVVHGRNREEHDQRLENALNRMKERNLTLNGDKCEFGMDKITFMGHVLSKNGIGPTSERVKALLNAKEPQNAQEVKSFLGLVNFSARYIPNLATISEPLRRLTKKHVKFEWGKEQKESFEKLKTCLTESSTLGHFRLDATRTQLICDASNVGIGAVLVQEYGGQRKIISYASRTLSDVEKKYAVTEKEALAVVWACEKFHVYLYGIKFELVTDHKALEVLYSEKGKPNCRVQRWVMKLLPYDFIIRYESGRRNVADALSRLVDISTVKQDTGSRIQKQTEDYIRFVAREATPSAITTREVEEASKDDVELINVRSCLKKEKFDKSCANYIPVKDELCKIGYIVLRGTRLVIPEKLRFKCIKLAHQGHLGVVGTKQLLRTKVWWPGIDRDVERYVRTCHGCQIVSDMPKPEPLKPTELPSGPWQDVCVDLLGPLDSGHYVFLCVDYYSRYYELEIMKDTSSERIIDALENMFSRHGYPVSITSDNGPQFRSAVYANFLKECGISQRRVTPLYPAANGEVERQNRSLLKRIRIAQAESKDWKKEIRTYLFAYRTTPHSVTHVAPAKLMFSRELRTKLPQVENMSKMPYDEELRDKDAMNKCKNKMYIDEKRGAKESDLETGSKVLVKKERQSKMDTPFVPVPYKLVDKHGNSCTVESPEGVQYKRNNTHVKRYQESLDDTHKIEDILPQTMDNEPETEGTLSLPSRPVRERRLPKKFDDFVMT